MTTKERLISFLAYKKISQGKFESETGLSTGFVNNVGDSIRKSSLEKIRRVYPELNTAWLLTGEGSMLKEGETECDNPVRDQSSAKRRIPFYDDVATVGGTNHLVVNDDSSYTPSEWIDAGDWFPEATAAIRHYGDSMVEYPSGSILALKRVEDHRLIIWGRNYSIETTEFRITKRLQEGGDDYIMAYSSNESTYSDGTLIHSPIKIPKETIRHIDLVLGCVTKEYSNGPIRIIK